ncbi:MAG: V-type ATPase subunit a family protein [archaeon]|nr:V-type ATPase subunit a family protein [archaeon]
MTHKKIRIPTENAEDIMRSLGHIPDSIEFVDLAKDNIEAKKNVYGKTLKRCEEIASKINDLESITNDFNQPLVPYKSYSDFSNDLKTDMLAKNAKTGSAYFDTIQIEIDENDKRIKASVESHGQIRESLISLIEKKHVLKKISELVYTNRQFRMSFGETGASIDGLSGSGLNFLAGTINTVDTMKMKRMIHRISRGRAIASFYDLQIDKDEYLFTTSIRQRGFSFADEEHQEVQQTQEELQSLISINPLIDETRTSDRKIFNIIFQGGEENILLNKILKVCEIFQASRYAVPKSSELPTELQIIEKEILEKKELLVKTEINLRDILKSNVGLISNGKGSKYSLYKLFFMQEKFVYSTLNKCLVRDSFIDGEVWIPTSKVDNITMILKDLYKDDESKLTATLMDINKEEILEDEIPPTYIETNEFVYAFQLIVSTYGVPRYREINPAYFTIITFPFLFGVMFGDIGHGIVLMLFALYLIVFKKYYDGTQSIIKQCIPARYLLFLMGFFGFFCGLMYNDFISIPIDFGSCYRDGEKDGKKIIIKDCTHKFGLDPRWYISSNELAFINSLKMKLSVIIGVAHMTLGILLNGLNFIFNKSYLDVIFVFIPQLVLMLGLFGYMDFLIFAKWSTDYTNKERFAPDIKSLLMDIFLNPNKKIDMPIWGTESQMKLFHFCILIGSAVCVILMLIPKAILDYMKEQKKYQEYLVKFGLLHRQNQQDQNLPGMEGDREEELIQGERRERNELPKDAPKFSEVFVHIIIETIEFVLGTVSNTASYLRLWALSLAHSQLSQVFFQYTVEKGATLTDYFIINTIILVYMFYFFALVTLGVLLMMDLMECFLHTLRLHWVEFQNKFFKADGHSFDPFSFDKIITEE